jgi:hypothetical protein
MIFQLMIKESGSLMKLESGRLRISMKYLRISLNYLRISLKYVRIFLVLMIRSVTLEHQLVY